MESRSPGKVYLVGAGPGDPELLTLKGRRVLAEAQVVLYDNLAPHALLALAPPDAELVYVGKKKSNHAFPQEEISTMLLHYAQQSLRVVRLKGGDPFIFGRGGEEVELLAEHGVPFEVVPGVTTPLGIAAYTGVPLTHREHTSVVTFVTGHNVAAIDWSRVGAADTLVLFMSHHFLPEIAREIMRSGRSADTPAMAVRWATRPDQQTAVGTLATLADLVREQDLRPPVTIIIGGVVELREKLNWFEKLPLFGKRIVVTRTREQAGELSSRLRMLGADVVELPTIAIQPPRDFAPLDRAIDQLASYDWIIFTSVNGVEHFLKRLDQNPRVDLRALKAKVAAIGPATRDAVERLHIRVDLMPERYVAESVVEAFAAHDLQGKRILLPRATVARDLIPQALTARGATVDVAPAYETVVPERSRELLAELTKQPAAMPDWITFTSSSTVTNFLELAPGGVWPGTRVASIGPVTSATVRGRGLAVDVEASAHTIDGLIDALLLAASR